MFGWVRARARGTGSAAQVPAAAPPTREEPEAARWGLEEGAEIAPGRRVLRAIGGGSRYEVFLAWDERLFALVVAKLLRPDQVASERALRELAREAEVLRRLAHPSLVRGFGAVLDGPRPHLLLEHVDGPTLHRLVRRYGPLPPEQLLPLALHVAAALHYLSDDGFVHLDVKPGNVVMGVPPRLIDLSIARTHADAARLAHAIGTDAFMAPEQCAPGEGRVGPAADVWGLGATLHFAAAGRVPFPRPRGAGASRDPAVRFPQLAAAAPPPPVGGIPAALAEVVAAMLDPAPARRPTLREVVHALEPLVAGVPDRVRFTARLRVAAVR